MKVLIAGSGDTGTHLAKMLSYEHQDVVLMSSDRKNLSELDSSYNIMVSAGNPTSVEDLVRSGVADADLFVAVTPGEAVNLTACQLAHHLGAQQCVARIESNCFLEPGISSMFARTGAGMLVYPELLVAREIFSFMKHNWMCKWIELHNGKLAFSGVKLPAEAPLCGKALKELAGTHRFFHVALIRRGHELVIPRGDDVLLKGDTVYFMLRPENEGGLGEVAGKETMGIRNVMIAGGGKITARLLDLTAKHYSVTVIEADRDRAVWLSENYPDVTVVNGSAKQLSVLKEEEIGKMDIFMALTDSDESNIVSCMVAKEFGVKRTVAQIEDTTYIAEAENLWIDKVVNKKLITSGAILRAVLGSEVKVGSLFSLEDAEVAEVEVRRGSPVTRGAVRELSIPAELTLGGLIRHGRGQLIEGSTVLEEGDRVIVIFRPGALLRVHRLFK